MLKWHTRPKIDPTYQTMHRTSQEQRAQILSELRYPDSGFPSFAPHVAATRSCLAARSTKSRRVWLESWKVQSKCNLIRQSGTSKPENKITGTPFKSFRMFAEPFGFRSRSQCKPNEQRIPKRESNGAWIRQNSPSTTARLPWHSPQGASLV